MGYEPKNINKKDKVIIRVDDGIGKKTGIEVGDILLSINDNYIVDVFDYRYHIQNKNIDIKVLKPSGQEVTYNVVKDEFSDLDIYFEEGLMDGAKSCKNKCVFCFIDQLPSGMRETLYFKDDDSRLSFLQGNYVTLTNMEEDELDRILFHKLSPINISVHSTDENIRLKMLKNPKSANIKHYLDKIKNNHTQMNFQVVLCKGYNDNENLTKTIKDLSEYIPYGESMSVVPFGMTKYRENLEEVSPLTKEDAITTINEVTKLQEEFLEKYGTRFVFLSDEFYLLAEMEIPEFNDYEDFLQLENGVGMLANFEYEVEDALDDYFKYKVNNNKKIAVITGESAYNFMNNTLDTINKKYKRDVEVIKVSNDFFGHTITVSGLLTGTDIINAINNKIKELKEKDSDLFDKVLIPENCLRDNDIVLLDDITISDIQKECGIEVVVVPISGYEFVKSVIEC